MNELDTGVPVRGGRMQIPPSRGAVSGFLLILLGAWGALIPFIGPYFNFAYTPDQEWTWTAARGWLEVLPGRRPRLAVSCCWLQATVPSPYSADGWRCWAEHGSWSGAPSLLSGLSVTPVPRSRRPTPCGRGWKSRISSDSAR